MNVLGVYTTATLMLHVITQEAASGVNVTLAMRGVVSCAQVKHSDKTQKQ